MRINALWKDRRDLYYICQNVERMMEMYSAELKILDRNTVQYVLGKLMHEN